VRILKKRNSGFTLIELMIAVAVAAILAGIAYPSYTEYVKKGRRSDAKAGLLDLQLKQENYRANCVQYATGIHASTMSCVAGGSHNLIGSTASPDQHYTLSIISASTNVVTASGTATLNAPSATTYALRATRTSLQTNDKCGDYAIDQNGVKYLISGTPASGYDVNKCW
jgi:type IV pilus assembly protein PilE